MHLSIVIVYAPFYSITKSITTCDRVVTIGLTVIVVVVYYYYYLFIITNSITINIHITFTLIDFTKIIY